MIEGAGEDVIREQLRPSPDGAAAPVAEAEEDLRSLEQRARPFQVLYEHWERTQWSVAAFDFSTDAASFGRLPAERQRGLVWFFAHRFHAEFNVATLLGPFLAAAPDYEMQLLLA